jgi:hypothetical protein
LDEVKGLLQDALDLIIAFSETETVVYFIEGVVDSIVNCLPAILCLRDIVEFDHAFPSFFKVECLLKVFVKSFREFVM